MKYKNLNTILPMDIQFFAGAGEDGQEAGGDDQDAQDNQDADEDGEEEESSEEKKYTEAEMEAAVEKRLNRERRKWKRQQSEQREGSDSGNKAGAAGDDGKGESEALKKEREKSAHLEMKWACLEHDVKKDCVDDVLALAKVYAEKEKDLDVEDAIDKVLEKYPQFKEGTEDTEDPEDSGKKKGWGQRQGKGAKNKRTLDDELKAQLFGEK